jgi:competence protein ComEC
MGVLVLTASTCYRKNDIWTSLSLSLLIILIYNPYLIENIGLQLSFAGTLGIILFNKNVSMILSKIKVIPNFIRELLNITISAQLAILPIQLVNFNTIGIYFLFTNCIVSIIIGPIVILAFFQIIVLCFSYNQKIFLINNFLSLAIQKILEPMLQILIYISQFSANLPLSKIYIATPNALSIVLYYVLLVILNQIFKIYYIKNKSATQIRIKNLINLFKYKINQNRRKVIAIMLTVCVVFTIFKIVPKNLKIYFIDVGQGDSCLIETPFDKTILIDGGGNIFDQDAVGKNTLLPYLLDRGITKIDYIIVSHFDSDHVRRYFVFATRD